MLWNRKTNAFTLSELLLGLLMAVLVVGSAFYALRYIRKQTTIWTAAVDNQTKITTLEARVWEDIYQRARAWGDQKAGLLSFYTALDTVSYQFTGSAITRNGQSLARLHHRVVFYYQGTITPLGPVDAVALQFEGDSIPSITLFFVIPFSYQLYP